MCRPLLRVVTTAMVVIATGCARSGERAGADAAGADETTAAAQTAVEAPPLHKHVRCQDHGRPVVQHQPSSAGGVIEGEYVRILYPANTFQGAGIVNVLPEPHLHGFRLSRAPQQGVEVWLRSKDDECEDPGPPYEMDAGGQMIPTQTKTWNGATWAVGTVPASALGVAADSVGVAVSTGFVILSN